MFDLLKELENYQPFDTREASNVRAIIDFLQSKDNCYSRTNLEGHITAGGFVADGKGNILLNHHKKSGMWFQFGGHSDGDRNSLNVATREIMEECGITNLHLISNKIFDVDVQRIANNFTKNEPEHFHYDINFLFYTDNYDYVLSNESTEIKWVTIDEAKKLVSQDDFAMHRMIAKYEQILGNRK